MSTLIAPVEQPTRHHGAGTGEPSVDVSNVRTGVSAQLAQLHAIRALLEQAAVVAGHGWVQGSWFSVATARGERRVTAYDLHRAVDEPVIGACLVGAVVHAAGGPRERPVPARPADAGRGVARAARGPRSAGALVPRPAAADDARAGADRRGTTPRGAPRTRSSTCSSRPGDRRSALWHPWRMPTVYDAAGAADGLLRLAHAWHERVMADEVVSHAFSHGFHPEHSARLAAYWAEALGGPTTFTEAYGDETSVVRMHSGNGGHEEMDRRAIACFDLALTDVDLDDPVRTVLHDYSPGPPPRRWRVTRSLPTTCRTACRSRGGAGTAEPQPVGAGREQPLAEPAGGVLELDTADDPERCGEDRELLGVPVGVAGAADEPRGVRRRRPRAGPGRGGRSGRPARRAPR